MQDWNQLRFFLALASHGTLSRAADKLKVNQSTVFRRLKQLEDELGFSLFIRSSNGYQLTAAGEQMLRHAQSIEDHFQQLQQTSTTASDELKGNIRVSTLDTIAHRVMPQLIDDFQKQHPAVTIDLVISESRHNLARREADIAIRATLRPPENLIGKKLLSQPWSLWASPKYLDQYGFPEYKQWENHKFLLGLDELGDAPAMQFLQHNIKKEQVVCRSNSMHALHRLCSLGKGIVPGLNFESGDLVKIMELPDIPHSELWMLYHPDQKTQPRIRAFTQFILKNFNH